MHIVQTHHAHMAMRASNVSHIGPGTARSDGSQPQLLASLRPQRIQLVTPPGAPLPRVASHDTQAHMRTMYMRRSASTVPHPRVHSGAWCKPTARPTSTTTDANPTSPAHEKHTLGARHDVAHQARARARRAYLTAHERTRTCLATPTGWHGVTCEQPRAHAPHTYLLRYQNISKCHGNARHA